jgi:hypothetical protein
VAAVAAVSAVEADFRAVVLVVEEEAVGSQSVPPLLLKIRIASISFFAGKHFADMKSRTLCLSKN